MRFKLRRVFRTVNRCGYFKKLCCNFFCQSRIFPRRTQKIFRLPGELCQFPCVPLVGMRSVWLMDHDIQFREDDWQCAIVVGSIIIFIRINFIGRTGIHHIFDCIQRSFSDALCFQSCTNSFFLCRCEICIPQLETALHDLLAGLLTEIGNGK